MATPNSQWIFSPRYIAKRHRLLCWVLKPLGWFALPMLSLCIALHAIVPSLLWIAFWLILKCIARHLYRPILPQERIGPLVIVYARRAEQTGPSDSLFPGEAVKLSTTAHAAGLLIGSMFAATAYCSGWTVAAGCAAGAGLYILIYLLAALIAQSDPEEAQRWSEQPDMGKTSCL